MRLKKKEEAFWAGKTFAHFYSLEAAYLFFLYNSYRFFVQAGYLTHFLSVDWVKKNFFKLDPGGQNMEKNNLRNRRMK